MGASASIAPRVAVGGLRNHVHGIGRLRERWNQPSGLEPRRGGWIVVGAESDDGHVSIERSCVSHGPPGHGSIDGRVVWKNRTPGLAMSRYG